MLGFRKVGEFCNRVGCDGNALGKFCNAGIARRTKKLGGVGTLFQFPNQGVFTSAATDHQNSHLNSCKQFTKSSTGKFDNGFGWVYFNQRQHQ